MFQEPPGLLIAGVLSPPRTRACEHEVAPIGLQRASSARSSWSDIETNRTAYKYDEFHLNKTLSSKWKWQNYTLVTLPAEICQYIYCYFQLFLASPFLLLTLWSDSVSSMNKGSWQKTGKYIAQNNLAPAVTQTWIDTCVVGSPPTTEGDLEPALCPFVCGSFCAKCHRGRRTCKSGRDHKHGIISVHLLPLGHQKIEKKRTKASNNQKVLCLVYSFKLKSVILLSQVNNCCSYHRNNEWAKKSLYFEDDYFLRPNNENGNYSQIYNFCEIKFLHGLLKKQVHHIFLLAQLQALT